MKIRALKMPWPRQGLSRNGMIALAAAYVLLALNWPVFGAARDAVRAMSPFPWGFVLTLPLFLYCLLLLLFNLLALPVIGRAVLAGLIVLSAAASYAGLSYGVVFDYGMIENVFQTHYGEAASYFNTSSATWVLVLGLAPALWLLRVKEKRPGPRAWIASFLTLTLAGSAGVAIIAGGFYQDYAVIGRNNRQLKRHIIPTEMVWNSYRYVNRQLLAPAGPRQQLGLDATHDRNTPPRLVVMMLGETARSASVARTGYTRDTNPYTAGLPGIVFRDTLSCGTATARSVPCMFSFMGMDHYDADDARSQDNVLDVIARAGTRVTWIDNDGGCKGVCQQVETLNLPADSEDPLCNGESCYDEILLRHLAVTLAGPSDQNRLVVLHMIGSHGPTYYQRYPASHRLFQPDCPRGDIQNCTAQELVNTYDNTIAYTDYVLSRVIELLGQQADSYATAMLYMSDHGESLGENGVYLHGLPDVMAPDLQKHVPTLAWLSPGMITSLNLAPSLTCRFDGNEQKVSHDFLPHTLLGLTGTRTALYRPELDLLNRCDPA